VTLAACVCAALAGIVLFADPASARLRRAIAATSVDDRQRPAPGRAAAILLARGRDPTRRREARRRRAAVIELCAGLAAELGAGGTARESMIAAARPVPEVAHLAAVAAAPHGDVAQALQTAAGRPGSAGLRSLAACWRVSERSGSALAPAVSRLAATLRDEEQVRREVAAQLAGPRATSVLLALLPAFGLLMGGALGADPLAVLVGTPAGRGCLALGLLLEATGLLWTARITRRAEPP
jgi:tight adherence protein B